MSGRHVRIGVASAMALLVCPMIAAAQSPNPGLTLMELGDDALALCRQPGGVQEVVAMDDERQLVWRAEP